MKPKKYSLISILTSAIFILSSFPVSSDPVPQGEFLPVANLAIPKSLGKIDERFTGTSKRWVIHIQDVHAHFTAQENIAAIVDHLNAVYGIKTAALEGGWHSTHFPKSWGIPNSRQKQMLARMLMEDAYLTGPAYAALFSQTPIHLVGIEDSKLYEEGRRLYLEHLNQREEVAKKIQDFGKKIAQEKQTVFKPELANFDHALADFREGKKAEQFLPSLFELSQAKNADISDLDQVSLFKQILGIESSLSKEKLEAEAKRIMADFKNQRISFEEILRNGKVPQEKIEFYPEVKKYLDLLKLQDKLTHRTFFSQIEETIKRVKEKIIETDEERALDKKSEEYLNAKKIILFQGTPDDLKVFENAEADTKTLMSENGLADALDLALRFYANAKKRDEVFFDKIAKDPNLTGDIVVVTGGFHTEGLTERFEKAGTNYAVITPDLANEAPNEDLYFKRLNIDPPASWALETSTDKVEPGNNYLGAVALFLDDVEFDTPFSERAMPIALENDLLSADRLIDPLKATFGSQKRSGIPPVINEGPPSRLKAQPTSAAPLPSFSTLSDEAAQKAVDDLWDSVLNGTQTAWTVIPADNLQQFMATPQGRRIVIATLSNEHNHLGVVSSSTAEAFNAMMEGSLNSQDNVRPFPNNGNFESVFRQQPLRDAFARDEVAAISDELKIKGTLLKRERVLSGRSVLAVPLSYLAVRGGLNYEVDTPEAIARFLGLIESSLAKRGLVGKSA